MKADPKIKINFKRYYDCKITDRQAKSDGLGKRMTSSQGGAATLTSTASEEVNPSRSNK